MPKASFSDGFGGVCTLAFSNDFVGVVVSAAVLEVFFWLDLFMPFTERLFFGFDAALFSFALTCHWPLLLPVCQHASSCMFLP